MQFTRALCPDSDGPELNSVCMRSPTDSWPNLTPLKRRRSPSGLGFNQFSWCSILLNFDSSIPRLAGKNSDLDEDERRKKNNPLSTINRNNIVYRNMKSPRTTQKKTKALYGNSTFSSGKVCAQCSNLASCGNGGTQQKSGEKYIFF